MERFNRMSIAAAGLVAGALLLATPALAGIHTWDVKEVFSNANGNIQFIELLDAGATGTEINVGNGTLTSTLHPAGFAFGQGQVAPPTNGRRYLIATAAFAALAGAPTPDVIIPAGLTPFFDTSGDTVTFSSGDSLTFGAVPTNGIDSFDEDAGVAVNSPENYAGVSGSVNAAPAVPSASTLALVTIALAMVMTVVTLHRRREAVAS